MTEKKNNTVAVSLTPEQREKMEQLSKQEQRTLGGQATYLWNKFVEKELDNLLGTPPSHPAG